MQVTFQLRCISAGRAFDLAGAAVSFSMFNVSSIGTFSASALRRLGAAGEFISSLCMFLAGVVFSGLELM